MQRLKTLLTQDRTLALLALIVFAAPLAVGQLNFFGKPLHFTASTIGFPGYLILLAGTTLALLSWVADRALTDKVNAEGWTIRISPALIALAVFLAWGTAATLASRWRIASLFGSANYHTGLLSWYALGVFCFLVIQELRSLARMRLLLGALAASSALVALVGLVQAAGLNPLAQSGLSFALTRSSATFGNPDLLGGYLSMTIFVCLGLALTERKRGLKLAWTAAFAINAVCLITSMTRGAWIAVIIAGALFIVVLIRRREHLGRNALIAGLVVLLLCAIPFVASLRSTTPDTNAGKRLSSLVDLSSPNVSSRREMWKSAASAIRSAPILGRGYETYWIYSVRYSPLKVSPATGRQVTTDDPHNVLLMLALETGVVGSLLLAGFFGWVQLRALRKAGVLQRGSGLSRIQLLTLSCVCGSVAFALYLQVGLASLCTWLVLICLLATLSAPAATRHTGQLRWATVPITVATALIAIVALYGVGRIAAADIVFGRFRTASAQERVAIADEALRLNPFADPYQREAAYACLSRGQDLLSAWANAGQTTAPPPDIAAELRRAITFSQAALRTTPDYFNDYVFIAAANNGLSSLDRATSKTYAARALGSAQRAIALQKEDFAGTLELVYASYTRGDTAKARQLAAEVVRRNPYSAEARQVLDVLSTR